MRTLELKSFLIVLAVVVSACGEDSVPIEPGRGVVLPSGEFVESEASGTREADTSEVTVTTAVNLAGYLRRLPPGEPKPLGEVPFGPLELLAEVTRVEEGRAVITVTGRNNGASTATGVVLENTLSEDVIASHSFSHGSCSPDGSKLTCTTEALSPGEQVVLIIELLPGAFGLEIENVATLRADVPEGTAPTDSGTEGATPTSTDTPIPTDTPTIVPTASPP